MKSKAKNRAGQGPDGISEFDLAGWLIVPEDSKSSSVVQAPRLAVNTLTADLLIIGVQFVVAP